MTDSRSNSPSKKNGRGTLWMIVASLIFSIWFLLGERSSASYYALPLTGANVNYIGGDISGFIGHIINIVSAGITSEYAAILQDPSNMKYLSAPVAALSAVPVYFLVKKGAETQAGAILVALLYLVFCSLIGPEMFSLLYFAIFPALFLWGVTCYAYGHKVLAFIFLLADIFVVPISAFAVLALSVGVFYKSWGLGNEGIAKNTFSIILEATSCFVFVDLFLKYKYTFFLQPSILGSVDAANSGLYHITGGLHILTTVFANILPLVPEFTNSSNLFLSGIVMAVVGVMGGLSKVAVNRVTKNA